MSKIEVNTIDKQSGSTLTLGGSGTAVTLACGATQSGFGRSGSVNWQTTPKTSTFTAANGEGYFINSGSALTMNLPAGSAGAIVAVSDYARNFATYNFTISPNGSEKIGGVTGDTILAVDGQASTFIYVDSTKGWINVQNAEDTEQGATFIDASGGTESTVCTNFKVHTFTGPGTFTVNSVGNAAGSSTVDYMVVGGGGGGGAGNGGGAGGGAGGWRASSGTASGSYTAGPAPLTSPVSALPVTAQGYSITVGGGGAGGDGSSPPSGNRASSGVASSALGISSAGGGGGGGTNCAPTTPGLSGGSGGGGAKNVSTGGAGNTPSTSPSQGNPGGNNTASSGNDGGGGGGAGDQGETVTWQNNRGGNGGIGVTSNISNTPTGYAGGGGANSEIGGVGGTGGVHNTGTTPQPSATSSSPRTPGFGGGNGHSGNGTQPNTSTAGGTNTGGGGGGIDAPTSYDGANGGSGIVVIRYRFQ